MRPGSYIRLYVLNQRIKGHPVPNIKNIFGSTPGTQPLRAYDFYLNRRSLQRGCTLAVRCTIGRVLAFSRIMRPRSYGADVSLLFVLARTPSMLLDTISVGPNTNLTWALAEHMMRPWLRPRALLERCSTRFFYEHERIVYVKL